MTPEMWLRKKTENSPLRLTRSMQILQSKFAVLILVFALCIGAGTPESLQKEMDRLDHDSEKSVMPASTMKILTTGAALGLLGPDFRYATNIEYSGKFDSLNGIVHGDLYIHGSGDPTLDSKYFTKDSVSAFDSISWWLKIMGVKKIEGNVIEIGRASCRE